VIEQGDVYWANLPAPVGSAPGFRHPVVVVQNNAFNRSRIQTVVVCPLTSNLARARHPGNVLLRQREANLPKPSVVNVAQITTIDKSILVQKLGSLSIDRVEQILRGVELVLAPTE
jgi:mRNA interferase MazF